MWWAVMRLSLRGVKDSGDGVKALPEAPLPDLLDTLGERVSR